MKESSSDGGLTYQNQKDIVGKSQNKTIIK